MNSDTPSPVGSADFFTFLKSVQKCERFSYGVFFFVSKMYIYWYFRRGILLVWSAVIITGIVGGNYYWYGRRKVILVLSAENNYGIFGGK